MCNPRYSSRLVDEHKKLHQIDPILFADSIKLPNWSDDPVLVDKFINNLTSINGIKYIQFLGGETLFIKSFYEICNRLIDNGMAKNIIMGTTTNCTFYDDRIEHIIKNFKQVHLGRSIESITDLNDYIRWPSEISNVLDNVHKFLSLREFTNLQISLRITPSVLSIWHFDQLIEFMIEHHIIAESCKILYDPPSLRMELLPEDLVKQILNKIKKLVTKPKITAFGLNWQHCNHTTFFPTFSYEQYYQSVRRCWRFGQTVPVTVDMISTVGQESVLANLKRKSDQADKMFSHLVSLMRNELKITQQNEYTKKELVPSWL
jgi:hypothetical protein